VIPYLLRVRSSVAPVPPCTCRGIYCGSDTYDLSRYLRTSFGGRTYRLRLFKAVTGRAGYLTGHHRARLTGDKIGVLTKPGMTKPGHSDMCLGL